jgi:Flp pilus assembly protein TadD
MSERLKQSEWHHEKARLAYQAGELESADAFISKALAANPRNADAMNLRGLVALRLGALNDAEMWITRAVQTFPHPAFCNYLCIVQAQLRNFAASEQSARYGIAIAQQHFPAADTSELWFNLGVALHLGSGTLEEAAQCYRQTLAINPEHAAAHLTLGNALWDLDDLVGAERHFQRSLDLDAQNFEAQGNLSYVLLATGRYEEGWPLFENRWANTHATVASPALHGHPDPALPIPIWRKGMPPGERRVLILPEQGLGDTLQFVRFLPLALTQCTRIGLVCPASLRRLFGQSFAERWPAIELLDGIPADLSDWDAYCWLLSLPMLLDMQLNNIPARMPYLHADREAARAWSTRLATLGNDALPRIGLVWAGGHSDHPADAWRSIAPERMGRLLTFKRAHWISLQKAENASKVLGNAQRTHIVDWMDEVRDFADTAALIDGLDLVISVDTSVAHLAAAMGKPVWMLNRFAGCWRWLRNRDDSPWYPGLRLFTQTERGNWDEVLTRVLATLETDFPCNLPSA